MCFATCCPSGWKIGGTNNGDFHVWVEDEQGNIYDPSFEEHDFICRINNLNIKNPIYRSWGNQEYWFSNIYHKDYKDLIKIDKKEMKQVLRNHSHTFAKCPENSIRNYCKLKLMGKKPRIVIGSMGWMKEDNISGHWEWG